MLVVPPGVTDAAPVAAAAARVHQEPGPIDLAVLSAGYWKQMDPAAWDTKVGREPSTAFLPSVAGCRCS